MLVSSVTTLVVGVSMAASRHYGDNVRAALTWLGDGTCYWPGCPERVVRLVDGQYKLALQIAHICALNPGGPRYNDSMSDPERNDFSNLLLLCYVHHKTIDGSRWERYTVAVLKQWKSERESSRSPALQTLFGRTEDRLQALMIEAFKDRTEQIATTLARLEQHDVQAARLLKELTDELAELRGRGSLIDPDAVSTLDDAAHRLGHLPDTASWLDDAAQRLGHLPDTASWLDDAAQRLDRIGTLALQLADVADRLESAAERIRGMEGLGGIF
jgi:hypothetical protein